MLLKSGKKMEIIDEPTEEPKKVKQKVAMKVFLEPKSFLET